MEHLATEGKMPIMVTNMDLSLKKVQEDSQESGRNKGGLQTRDLLSQNYQLETYRMTLKSRRQVSRLLCTTLFLNQVWCRRS
ncbi:Potassium Voltage-Gated Channel Subfamily V Member 2 [Manis pentadactyla]|nr:Potassium Voltage-Gated Channel Subfamily V Member 2 [Manis pentadactyla]